MERFSVIELQTYYELANEAFRKCVLDQNNSFLKTEINEPLESIVTKEEFVIVKYTGVQNDPVIEICIALFGASKAKIGSYSYFVDSDNQPIDDSLIFD